MLQHVQLELVYLGKYMSKKPIYINSLKQYESCGKVKQRWRCLSQHRENSVMAVIDDMACSVKEVELEDCSKSTVGNIRPKSGLKPI